jgi:hypothetical protein
MRHLNLKIQMNLKSLMNLYYLKNQMKQIDQIHLKYQLYQLILNCRMNQKN